MKKLLKRSILMLMILVLVVSVSSDIIKEPVLIIDDKGTYDVINKESYCKSSGLYPNGSTQCFATGYRDVVSGQRSIYDGVVRVNGKSVQYDGYFCRYQGNNIVHCVAMDDGVHKADPSKTRCQFEGGMTCKIINIQTEDTITVRDTKLYINEGAIKFENTK